MSGSEWYHYPRPDIVNYVFFVSPDFFDWLSDEELDVHGQEAAVQVELPADEAPNPLERRVRRRASSPSQNPAKRRRAESLAARDPGNLGRYLSFSFLLSPFSIFLLYLYYLTYNSPSI